MAHTQLDLLTRGIASSTSQKHWDSDTCVTLNEDTWTDRTIILHFLKFAIEEANFDNCMVCNGVMYPCVCVCVCVCTVVVM